VCIGGAKRRELNCENCRIQPLEGADAEKHPFKRVLTKKKKNSRRRILRDPRRNKRKVPSRGGRDLKKADLSTGRGTGAPSIMLGGRGGLHLGTRSRRTMRFDLMR